MCTPQPNCMYYSNYVHQNIVNSSIHLHSDNTHHCKLSSRSMRQSHRHSFQQLDTQRHCLIRQFKYLLLSLWSLYTMPVCILHRIIRESISMSGIVSHLPQQYPMLHHLQLPRNNLFNRYHTQQSLCKLYIHYQNRPRSPCKYYHREQTIDPCSFDH